MSQKRIAVARLWFEGNSFCPRLTTLADFLAREWHDARTAPDFYRNSHTEMGAVIDWMEQHADQVRTIILRCTSAPPGGPLATGTFGVIVDEIIAKLGQLQSTQPLDGVYLSLHGSMMAQDIPNADYSFVKKVRDVIGPDCPLALSFDLHANLDPALAELAQIIVGYKTYPHIDMAQTATRALQLLSETMNRRIQPVSTITSAELIIPSHLMATENGPMSAIEQIADQWVVSGELLDATPFGGFAYGDSKYTSASASICIDVKKVNGDPVHAKAKASLLGSKLVNAIRARKNAFLPSLPNAAEGIRHAVELLAAQDGCIAVVDPADNPLSGGTGDTTGLFQALIDAKLSVPTVFAFFHDPLIVRRAIELGLGAELRVRLGGRITSDFGPAVDFHGRIEQIANGQFVNDGPMEQGLACNLGFSVVLSSVEQPNLSVVICSQCNSPNDMAWCRMHNIDLTKTRLFCVKAKNHFRAAFRPHLLHIIDIDAPGPAMLNLSALPYRHINRNYLATQ
jgi:microcystin degradation protein MlrC